MQLWGAIDEQRRVILSVPTSVCPHALWKRNAHTHTHIHFYTLQRMFMYVVKDTCVLCSSVAHSLMSGASEYSIVNLKKKK